MFIGFIGPDCLMYYHVIINERSLTYKVPSIKKGPIPKKYRPGIYKSITLAVQFYLTAKSHLTVPVDTVEYHQSTLYLYRR